MCNTNCSNCPMDEGILVEEEVVVVPVSRYEDLIRAETERNVLEAAIDGLASYDVKDVLAAIKKARERIPSADQPTKSEEDTDGNKDGE